MDENEKSEKIRVLLKEASLNGKLGVPIDEFGTIEGVGLPEGQIFLRPNQKLEEVLEDASPTATIPCCGMIYDLSKEGFDPNGDVNLYSVLYYKTDGGGIEGLESERINAVEKRYSSEHIGSYAFPETVEYDTEAFERISFANNSTSLAMALVAKNKEGKFVCLGSADIKYGATSEYIYQYDMDEPISKKYVVDFLKRSRHVAEYGFDFSEELPEEQLDENEFDQILQEREDGNFDLHIKQVSIPEGGLPVDSLFRDMTDCKRPLLEIGQFVISKNFDGGSIFIIASLTRLLETALKKNPNLVAGLSISPHLLKQVLSLNSGRMEASLKGLERFFKVQGFKDYDEFLSYINVFAKQMKLFSKEGTKKALIKMKDGKMYSVNALIQADTFESAAFFDGTDRQVC